MSNKIQLLYMSNYDGSTKIVLDDLVEGYIPNSEIININSISSYKDVKQEVDKKINLLVEQYNKDIQVKEKREIENRGNTSIHFPRLAKSNITNIKDVEEKLTNGLKAEIINNQKLKFENRKDEILNNLIGYVSQHCDNEEEEKIAFKDIIGLSDEECELLGIEFNENEEEEER